MGLNCEKKIMKDSIAIANYFIDRSKEDGKGIDLLKLVKLVYIAHGYILALLGESYLNKKYDKVEAWKYGPVIPTVYHTFKHNANGTITENGIVCVNFDKNEFVEPAVEEEPKKVLDFVWKRYGRMDSSTLVTLLHKDGTPWKYHYKANMNVEIPDEDTKIYYEALFNELAEYGRRKREQDR